MGSGMNNMLHPPASGLIAGCLFAGCVDGRGDDNSDVRLTVPFKNAFKGVDNAFCSKRRGLLLKANDGEGCLSFYVHDSDELAANNGFSGGIVKAEEVKESGDRIPAMKSVINSLLFHIGMLWEHHSTGKEIVSTQMQEVRQ
jgi:hypothetical protein